MKPQKDSSRTMARVFPWRSERHLDLGIGLPLAWALMQDVTLRTTTRLVVPGWDAGYGDLYRYGFPSAFTRWGTSSSEVDVFFLLPMLLDLGVYFLVVAGLLRVLKPALLARPLLLWLLIMVAWGWMLLTAGDVFWGVLGGQLKWVEPYEVLSTWDPQFSWRKGGNLDGYGPH